MFKGIYHGKKCHAADIPAVLARAWATGVDRIIVIPVFDVKRLRSCLVSVQCREAVLHGRRAPNEMSFVVLLSNPVHCSIQPSSYSRFFMCAILYATVFLAGIRLFSSAIKADENVNIHGPRKYYYFHRQPTRKRLFLSILFRRPADENNYFCRLWAYFRRFLADEITLFFCSVGLLE
jgi:hypothetical protein